MKLLVFNKFDRVANGSIGLRTITVCRKAKTVTISRQFVRDEGIESNGSTFAVLALDEESKNDWYIAIGNHTDGFKINSKEGKETSYGITHYFCCGQVALRFLDANKISNTASFLVAERPTEIDGVKWFRIITSKPVSNK